VETLCFCLKHAACSNLAGTLTTKFRAPAVSLLRLRGILNEGQGYGVPGVFALSRRGIGQVRRWAGPMTNFSQNRG